MSFFFCTFVAVLGRQEMLEIWIDDDMSRCTAEEVARLLSLVSAQRREEALKYKNIFHQYCCLRSWEMVGQLVMRNRQSLSPEANEQEWRETKWLYNEHGKPYIAGGPHFSLSHCKEAIAVAISDRPVGIDIESIRPAKEELIARVMSEEEKRKVGNEKQQAGRDRMFTRLWTQKEAILKAQGTGILSFEQLQGILSRKPADVDIQTVEKEKYIYSIANGKLHCFGAEIQTADL